MNKNYYILAGGKGSRMGELSRKIPKPLIKIGNLSIIERTINSIEKLGSVAKINLIVGYKADEIEALFRENKIINLLYFKDHAKLGPVSALAKFTSTMSDQVVVLNGDTYYGAELVSKIVEANVEGVFLITAQKKHKAKDDLGVIIKSGKVSKVGKALETNNISAGALIVNGGEAVGVFKEALLFLGKSEKKGEHHLWHEVVNKMIELGTTVNSIPVSSDTFYEFDRAVEKRKFERTLLKKTYYLLDNIIPHSKKILVFGAGGGDAYFNNSRALYEWFVRNKPEYRCYWLSRNKEIVNFLRQKKLGRPLYSNSLWALWISLRANSVFISHGFYDIGSYFWPGRNKKIIQLWHAIKTKKTGIVQGTYPAEYGLYDMMIASSDLDKAAVIESFGVGEEKVFVTGLPKNDYLFENIQRQKGKKRILYAPTFAGKKLYELNDYDDKDFMEFISSHNIEFVVSFHKNDHLSNNPFSRLMVKKQFDEIQPELANSDILITNHSSIYLDFLILERPIIFLCPDFTKMMYGEKYIPGEVVFGAEELKKAVINNVGKSDMYSEKRDKIMNDFYKYRDGLSCERVYQAWRSLIK